MIAEIIAALEQEPLCVDCLAKKVEHRRGDVANALNEFRRTLRLSEHVGICQGCVAVRMTYRLA